MKLNGLEKYFEIVNGEIIDFNQINKDGDTPLISALWQNKSKKFNLKKDQLDYLIKNSDLKQVDSYSLSPLMYALVNNKSGQLNLSAEQFDYLIKNSNLKQVNKDGLSSLNFAFEYYQEQNLNLSKEQWKYLIDNSDLSLVTDENQLMELKKIQEEITEIGLSKEEIVNKIKLQQAIKEKEWIENESFEKLLSNRENLDKVINFYHKNNEEKATKLLKGIVNLKIEQLGELKPEDFKFILGKSDVKELNMKERLQLKLMNDVLSMTNNISNDFTRKKII